MDAGHLGDLGAGTFGGVVDKGTIDAVLSGGLEPARRICQEAMRVVEPGGTFLVISNMRGEELLETLLSMCGPGSACDSPLAVPVVGGPGPCVYAYIVRKSRGKGGGVAYARGQANSPRPLEKPSESGAAAVEDRSADGAGRATVGGAAPRSDSHVSSELEPPVERRTLSAVDGGFDGRPRGGVMGGLSASDRGHGRTLSDSQPEEVELCKRRALGASDRKEADSALECIEKLRRKSRMADVEAFTAEYQRLRAAALTRSPPPGAGSGAGSPPPRMTLREAERRADLKSIHAIVDAQARMSGDGLNAEPPPVAARNGRPPEQPQQQAPQPVLPEQHRSLPWGSQESFTEDQTCATYELKFDTELSPSKLSVEIGTTHLKACYRRQPGDSEVLLDRELYDKVTAESTWCIEDKTVLSFK